MEFFTSHGQECIVKLNFFNNILHLHSKCAIKYGPQRFHQTKTYGGDFDSSLPCAIKTRRTALILFKDEGSK